MDISTPPLSSHVHTKGAPDDGGRVMDPPAHSCSWSFPELYRKIRRERENSRGHRRAERWRVGKRSDKMAHSRGRPSTDFFAGKEKPSISPGKMTIRRGWLGKRLFIATHIQTSLLYTLVDIFREFSVKRGIRYNLRGNEKFLYKNCYYNTYSSNVLLCYLQITEDICALESSLSRNFRDLFNDLVNNRHLSKKIKRYSSFYARTSEIPSLDAL